MSDRLVDEIMSGEPPPPPRLSDRLRNRARRIVALRSAERLCVFVGYPRSGHSLVGAMVNAHRRALIAHELRAVHLAIEGWDKRRIVEAIIQRERDFAARGREWNEYSYEIPGGHQGSGWRPLIIGDKKGGGTTRLLRRRPEGLVTLSETFGLPVSVIHVTRHPFDNVASISLRAENRDLPTASDHYAGLASAVGDIRTRGDADWLDVRVEDVITDPKPQLAAIAEHLGLAPDAAWLDACAAVVLPAPQLTRERVTWPAGLQAEVAARVADLPVLGSYDF